jgi:predicted nucleic acid-binding protein
MIAYDSNVLIYYLESHAEFGKASKHIITEHAKQGVALSALVQQEVLTGFALRSQSAYTTAQKALAALEHTTFIPVTEVIAQQAAELTSQYGRRLLGYDALHIATALAAEVTEFYTNDLELLSIGTVRRLIIKPL